jgi:hypothetical protein
MYKRVCLLFIMMSTASSVFAQPFFESNPVKNAAEKNTLSFPKPHAILSPNDFKSTVNTLNQQTQSNMSKQLNQQLAQQPSPPSNPMVNPSEQKNPIPPPTPPSGFDASSASPITPPPKEQPEQQEQNDFGPFQDNRSSNQQPPSSHNAGGWNVQY